jgi:ADP-ribose pyrophosphatase YjhB (NUDIX family)
MSRAASRDYTFTTGCPVYSLILQKRKQKHVMTEQIQITIGVLITKEDHVLLMKRTDVHGEGTWAPPRGNLGHCESLEACAARAMLEEMDISITDVTFLAITNDVFKERHYVTIWTAGRHVSGEPTMNADNEISTGWFAWDALPAPLFSPFENLLTGQCYPALWDFSGGRKPI